MAEMTPQYLSIDFLTLVEKFKTELGESDIFRDYDYEGSNISVLLELMAYISELNTFFINKVAKNTFLETADVYEAANRLARQVGYEPKGTRSARCTLNVTVTGADVGDVLKVAAWKQLKSGRTDSNDNEIQFATTSSVEVTASSSSETIRVPVRQGIITTLTGYTGDDLIDNELILPEQYAYDDDLDDSLPSIKVTINDIEWARISDFYENLLPENQTGTIENDVYMFVYDRYERNKLVFNSSRNIPDENDDIEIIVLDSLGTDGSIGADSTGDAWSIVDSQFIENTTKGTWVDNTLISIDLSASSIGASAPETITELRNNAASALRSQFRNVTNDDYNSHLSSRSDVVKANAWGEQDIAPSAGDPQEYNNVHISVIPKTWSTSTISTSADSFTTEWGLSGTTLVPLVYSSSWETTLKEYTKPRKMISAYEIYELPELVYFAFEIGVKIKRTYTFIDVKQDVLDKLIYYFRSENQEFNSKVSPNDIIEYLLDTTEVSPNDEFTNIKGIRNLNIRDVNLNKGVYSHSSDSTLYPRFVEAPSSHTRDNALRTIEIGFNQFPLLASDGVKIYEETN